MSVYRCDVLEFVAALRGFSALRSLKFCPRDDAVLEWERNGGKGKNAGKVQPVNQNFHDNDEEKLYEL